MTFRSLFIMISRSRFLAHMVRVLILGVVLKIHLPAMGQPCRVLPRIGASRSHCCLCFLPLCWPLTLVVVLVCSHGHGIGALAAQITSAHATQMIGRRGLLRATHEAILLLHRLGLLMIGGRRIHRHHH